MLLLLLLIWCYYVVVVNDVDCVVVIVVVVVVAFIVSVSIIINMLYAYLGKHGGTTCFLVHISQEGSSGDDGYAVNDHDSR